MPATKAAYFGPKYSDEGFHLSDPRYDRRGQERRWRAWALCDAHLVPILFFPGTAAGEAHAVRTMEKMWEDVTDPTWEAVEVVEARTLEPVTGVSEPDDVIYVGDEETGALSFPKERRLMPKPKRDKILADFAVFPYGDCTSTWRFKTEAEMRASRKGGDD